MKNSLRDFKKLWVIFVTCLICDCNNKYMLENLVFNFTYDFLQQADFYEYMKEHDEELLKFDAGEFEVSH